MSDYTPTTEQVREIYAEIRHESTGLGLDPHRAEFDRWLEQVRAEAWEEGAETAWNRSTPEVNGARYHWRHEGEPTNPYRKEQSDD